MNRQSTDLLDFFGQKGTKKPGGARARASAPREPRTALVLGRAHVLLGAAGLVVLMLLSFVFGLSVGRRKATAGGDPALAAVKPTTPVRTWSIRSRSLPRVGSGAEALIEVAQAEFARKFPLLSGYLDTTDVFDKKGKKDPGYFRLVIRGFPTREAADSWRNDLQAWSVGDYVPFLDARADIGETLPR